MSLNKTKIEWTERSWNPVVGCEHNCWYCYGKGIAKRFFKNNPDYEPRFYPERLKEPYKLKKPSKIFVCSMADLFGDWVPKEWIEKIIKVAQENPRHTFQFLTKNPKRYSEFEFPKNCWLGATIEMGSANVITGTRLGQMNEVKEKSPNSFCFISIEPLLGDFKHDDLSGFDLVIIGAMTGMGSKNVIPEKEWIDSIEHHNIFFKKNIKKYL